MTMKKITALFLVLFMLLPMLLACSGDKPEETTGADVPEVTTAADVSGETTAEDTALPETSELLLAFEGATDYVIVRSEDCQSFIIDAMQKLR